MADLLLLPLLSTITWGTFKFSGNFTTLDPIAASTNAQDQAGDRRCFRRQLHRNRAGGDSDDGARVADGRQQSKEGSNDEDRRWSNGDASLKAGACLSTGIGLQRRGPRRGMAPRRRGALS
jgi:hypothetical protein